MIIHNIQLLAGLSDNKLRLRKGKDMAEFPAVANAFVLISGNKIADYGSMGSEEYSRYRATNNHQIVDAEWGTVLPSFCDSHTHLVYPASREIEYIDKIKGLSYQEIAKRGGGILNSAERMQHASEDELFEDAMQRLNEIIDFGTGAVEIKSGYGLTTESELKMLRVIRRLKETSPLIIKASFLGAHAVPLKYKKNQSAYVDLIIDEMIPKVAAEQLADFIDVFCDQGFFTVEETDRILEAGWKYGLRPKIHANELAKSGGIQIGVKHNALSVDHLEYTGEEEIAALSASQTMPTILPGAAFFLNMPYAPARQMIEAGLPVAMASDFNPGSSPSGNMQLILSMASILYRMLPEEGLNATTINSAYAMDIADQTASISRGKIANLMITKPIPSLAYLPYYYGSNKLSGKVLQGKYKKV